MDEDIGMASKFAGVAFGGRRAELRSFLSINDTCERDTTHPIIGRGSLLSQG
jgi:hypothetical protein